MHFGPDGYLYVSLGDEGRQNDQFNNSQKIASDFFSGLLRIDVDKKEGSLEPNPHASVPTDNGIARYSVPADNPYVGITTFNGSAVTPSAVRTEFWAAGMRNPWRFSFDGNELWLAESLEETGLLYGEAANNGGNSANKLVVPGDVPHSIVYNRVAVANGFTRMPPLGTSELDQVSIDLLAEWIGTSLPSRQDYDAWRLDQFGSSSSPEGDPMADPDADGFTNRQEFLAMSQPKADRACRTFRP